jgi:hypothetical protein
LLGELLGVGHLSSPVNLLWSNRRQ